MPKDPPTPRERARAVVLRLLAIRARTEAQLRARLARDGLETEADDTIGWLRHLGYLDDAAYARARARGLLTHGRAGPRLAERRLAAEGIPAGDARAAVAEALGGVARGATELELCRALALRRTRGADPAAQDERARARLARFLLGRGFAGAVVARVVGSYQDAE